MLVSGLWHNATLAMVTWGGLHGLYLSFDHMTGRNAALDKSSRSSKVIQAIKVFLLLLPTWILFSCGGLKQAYAFSLALVVGGGMLRTRPLEMVIPICAIILSLAIDSLQEFHTEEKTLARFPAIIQSTFIAIAILSILLSIHWSGVPSASFVYQTF
jgi:alginate O-acetyltransferase complex protein AlgI